MIICVLRDLFVVIYFVKGCLEYLINTINSHCQYFKYK